MEMFSLQLMFFYIIKYLQNMKMIYMQNQMLQMQILHIPYDLLQMIITLYN